MDNGMGAYRLERFRLGFIGWAFFIVLAVKVQILVWQWGVNHELCAAGAVT